VAAKCQLEYQELIGEDVLWVFLDIATVCDGFGQKTIYIKDDAGHLDMDNLILKTPEDYIKLERFDPTRAPRTKELIKMADILANERGATVPVWAVPSVPLNQLCYLRGFEDLYRDCLRCPEAIVQGLETVTDVLTDLSKALIAVGVNLIMWCPDSANAGVLSAKHWKATEGMVLPRLYRAVKEAGGEVGLHLCGQGPYLQESIGPEVDVCQLQDLPTDCNSWQEVKEKYGSKVCILGHLDGVDIGMFRTPEEVKQECKKQIEELYQGGGYILGTGCEFAANGSLLNAKTVLEASELYGRYGK
jgi:uroporphyrinogen decarboxylase